MVQVRNCPQSWETKIQAVLLLGHHVLGCTVRRKGATKSCPGIKRNKYRYFLRETLNRKRKVMSPIHGYDLPLF